MKMLNVITENFIKKKRENLNIKNIKNLSRRKVFYIKFYAFGEYLGQR